MNIYTASQIKEWDAYTIAHEPITSLGLMERSAKALLAVLLHDDYNTKQFYIFCGTGNNGGDGLAVSRMLIGMERNVQIFILAEGEYSVDCASNIARLQQMGHPPKEIDGAEEFPIIPANAIVVDALFGTGLNRPLEGLAANLVQHINQHAGTIISIDLPSGLYADRASESNHIVSATVALSFEVPKLAFLMACSAVYIGRWKILPIGLHKNYCQQNPPLYELVEAAFIKQLIKPKAKFTHKYNYGHALLYAGSPGMYGAGILCAKACLKSGVGLVSIMVEEKYLAIYQTSLPEAICVTEWNIDNLMAKKTALGIGPGWGYADAYVEASQKVLIQLAVPVVIDAAALQHINIHSPSVKLMPGSIITPHTGEFDKLFGNHNSDFERFEKALQKAKEFNIYVILKGAHTLIATPEGKAYFNSTGNAGMAKSGSGDVLTGLLTGLLAQGYTALHTCLVGVYLHGLAGNLAANLNTQYAMTALDIIDALSEAWKLMAPESNNIEK